MKKAGIFSFIFLQLMVAVYSFGGIFGKLAARYSFMSFKFCLYYAALAGFLFIYAIGWQQIIKTMPLSVAYANRAVTVAWGMIWGFLIYSEKITAGKIIGSLIVISGVILYAFSDNETEEKKDER